jgi:hypothetical protein
MSTNAIEQCIKSLFKQRTGNETPLMINVVQRSNLMGILPGIWVKLYQESGANEGLQYIISNLGPKAMHLPIKNAHNDAEMANNMRICLIFTA